MAIAESGAAKWGQIMRSTVTFLGGIFALGVSLAVAAPLAAQSANAPAAANGPAAAAPVKSPEQIRCELFARIEDNACVIPRGKLIEIIPVNGKTIRDQGKVKEFMNQNLAAPRVPKNPPVRLTSKVQALTPAKTITYKPVRGSDLFINFDLGSAEVNPQAEAQTKNLVEAVRQYGLNKYKFLIGGHTDSIGSPAYNDDLSRRRAETIAKLLRLSGMDADNLVVKGYGYRMPLEGMDRTDGRNRRVEILLLEEAPTAPAAK